MLSNLVNSHGTVTLIVSKLITLRSLHNNWCIWEIRESQRNCFSKKFIESELAVGHDSFRVSLLFLDALKINIKTRLIPAAEDQYFMLTVGNNKNGFQIYSKSIFGVLAEIYPYI